MNEFKLLAEPWWVNIFFFLPFISYYIWRKRGLEISKGTLMAAAFFGIAFGFMEASVVVYLRAAIGLLPGYQGTLADVVHFSAGIYQQTEVLGRIPKALLTVDYFRETATIIMLLTLAFLSAKASRERFALFVWTFAIWDIFYYVSLWATVRWPDSLLSPDILFLIPVPWLSQVWFPLTASGLCLLAVIMARKKSRI